MEFANLGLLLLFHVNDYYLLFLLCVTLSATVLAQMAKIPSRKVISVCEHAAFKINEGGEKNALLQKLGSRSNYNNACKHIQESWLQLCFQQNFHSNICNLLSNLLTVQGAS